MTAGAWRIARITLGCGALLTAAPGTDAVTLGKAELRSRRGEPLEARIPLSAGPSEALRGACFSLLPEPRGPLAAGSRLELRHHARGADLYVRSRAAVNDPAVAFAIAVACPGSQGGEPVRYSLALSDAAPAPAPLSLPVIAPAATALPVVTRLPARDGDTFASLAHAIFPGDAEVRRRYIAAMRAENDALASLGDDEPLPAGTAVALPDLHAFAATVPASRPAEGRAMRSTVASRPSTRAAKKAGEAPTSLAQVPESLRTKSAPSAAPHKAAAHEAAAAHPRSVAQRGEGFQLRLSAPVMDLAPSQGMDEQRRAELRERLLVLEADDRTAAMLEMRENIRRLESQVNALKLKLATLEAAPVPKAEPPQAKVEPQTKLAAAPVAPPTPAPIAKPAPVAPPTPAPIAKAAPASPAKAAPAPAPSRPAVRTEAPRKPRAAPAQPWYEDRRWLGGIAAILVIAWLALRMRVRSAEEPEIIEVPPEEYLQRASDIPDTGAPPTTEPHDAGHAGESGIATRVPPDDRTELRRRYMEERFPEIVNGALVLEDERSVVKAARLLYEDGTAPRAIELLQFAIEQDPEALHPWLALFEIFRLEKLPGEFGALAARFRDRHGATDEWRQVRSVGRLLDPANRLYEGTEYGAPVDTQAEGWLRSPSDDAGRALAGELRAKLMSEAGVTEEALRADPTPALRKAEMFNVA